MRSSRSTLILVLMARISGISSARLTLEMTMMPPVKMKRMLVLKAVQVISLSGGFLRDCDQRAARRTPKDFLSSSNVSASSIK